jgi:excisionase family DNA binding protein
METFLIDLTMLKNLIAATESIRKSQDLVSQDLPVLAAQAAALQGAVASQMAACAQDQQLQIPSNAQENEELVTVEEASEILQLSTGYLYGLIRKGKFPAKRIGERGYRVRKLDTLNWNYHDAHREPSQSSESKHCIQNNRCSSHKLPESYEKRVRGPRQQIKSVN